MPAMQKQLLAIGAALCGPFLLPWMACMPVTQEQLQAIAMDGMVACNAGAVADQWQALPKIKGITAEAVSYSYRWMEI